MSASDECPPVRHPSDVHCLSVCRPLSVRRGIVRVPPVSSPYVARGVSVPSPCAVRRRAAAHLGMSQNVGNRRMPARPPPVCRPLSVRGESSVCSPWRVRFPSVASPPTARRRPSWDSWIRPSLTDARPSPVRAQSVSRPWPARVASTALCFTSTIRRLWLPPVSRRARTPHEPTQDERHTGRDRTQNEQPTNTDAPARQASRESTRTVERPCEVRD